MVGWRLKIDLSHRDASVVVNRRFNVKVERETTEQPLCVFALSLSFSINVLCIAQPILT